MRKSLAFAAILVGIFDSSYLTWAYTSLSHRMVCAGGGCDLVRASAYAYPFGIPMPIPGLIFYVVLAALALIDAHRPSERVWKTIAVLSGAGVLFSAWLTYLEAFVIHGFCTWCVVQAICVLIIFVLALSIVRSGGRATSATSQARKFPVARYVILAIAIAAGVPAMISLTKSETIAPSTVAVTPTDAGKLIRSDSYWTGNPNAPLTIVEFGDFQCPSCGVAEKTNRAIRDQFGNDVKFVFRQFPLAQMHAYAFGAAKASECAGEQGKFWPMVETLYSNQTNLTEPALKSYAESLGLNEQKFDACMQDPAITARINRDVADGTALGVHATPTFFLNGKQKIEGGLTLMEVAGAISAAKKDEAAAQHAQANDKVANPADDQQSDAKEPSSPAAKTASPKAKDAAKPAPPPAANSAATASPIGFGTQGGSNPFAPPSSSSPFVPCGLNEKPAQDPPMIHTAEMRKLFEDKSAVFVDVRGHAAFKEAHIPSAVNATIDQLQKKVPPELSKNRLVVLYEAGGADDSCTTSKTAGRILMQDGFKEVKVFKEGLEGWRKEGLPVAQ
jgi:protein-disulfide isomerase/rhodanese-related sulfurtransferase